MCIHNRNLSQSLCRLCTEERGKRQKDELEERRKVERREVALWVERLKRALEQSKSWGLQGERLRIKIREAIASGYIKELRLAGKLYDDFRRGVGPFVAEELPTETKRSRIAARKRKQTKTETLPLAAAEAPRGCSVRPEERWGPWSGSFIQSAGRVESNRRKH
jgi:hypothetical protein